jgi:host factor-I protein
MLVSWNLLASDSAKRLSGRSTEGHEVWRNLYYFGNLQAKEIGTMDSKPAQNIQDTFLNTVRKDKSPITIYLVSGVKLTGKIRSFDKYSVLLENNSQEQLIFKHAISTVVSGRMGGGHGDAKGDLRSSAPSQAAVGTAAVPPPVSEVAGASPAR